MQLNFKISLIQGSTGFSKIPFYKENNYNEKASAKHSESWLPFLHTKVDLGVKLLYNVTLSGWLSVCLYVFCSYFKLLKFLK